MKCETVKIILYPDTSARTFLFSDLTRESWDLRECRDTIDHVLTTGLPEMIRRARGDV